MGGCFWVVGSYRLASGGGEKLVGDDDCSGRPK